MSTDTDAPPYDYAPELEPADVLDAQAVREVGAPKAARPNGHRASPHDTNAEEATLGAMLTTATACDEVLATGISAGWSWCRWRSGGERSGPSRC